ncbi:type II toxin-antitoxin system RelE/ParE family toxin [Tenacibaculum finnmarkense genomovar finnmarkense]|uniref:Plasmid maintenance system killer protein n=1 Tax=Tenacibaculum finnmarkense genomovar finnmarkense TaxID=1458503 RepID=A0AAP1RHA5_9FLAO|nr:type II toxin-antitoxin system RelE/ParE family toxin [Tenacibaculum finnmarkense]MCD8416016.1 type II toxin-antitoxin system RelE/ParE family toxin [Tenacibaculum dicentrarchi]MBE7635070.1 plasmid maintenance system killer protein [Tenacibaculum finnmarkense genomovar ulcerans]MBE7649218.1 plasmid maintenance system killer protein [Tenacibaculum finnmarkense genomovar ulcerans]MBE7653906.1 plasmid maintenance system killer protein [Tenacibaculum finnmarkense genomovar finnmarkense]MBE76614
MEINFEKDYLKELYEEGKAKNKKYRFQKVIIRKYKNSIDKLRVAEKIEDLFFLKSLNYEKLKGDKKGLESIRVDQKYRIEFISSVEGEEPNCITICSIVELSNHYK